MFCCKNAAQEIGMLTGKRTGSRLISMSRPSTISGKLPECPEVENVTGICPLLHWENGI